MKIELTTEREDRTPRQAEKQAGYAKGFSEAVADMKKKATGLWGWCCVKLTVTYKKDGKTVTGTSYLGECSYENERDFVQNSGYFKGMLDDAIADAR